jgi:hypothetical protein
MAQPLLHQTPSVFTVITTPPRTTRPSRALRPKKKNGRAVAYPDAKIGTVATNKANPTHPAQVPSAPTAATPATSSASMAATNPVIA